MSLLLPHPPSSSHLEHAAASLTSSAICPRIRGQLEEEGESGGATIQGVPGKTDNLTLSPIAQLSNFNE